MFRKRARRQRRKTHHPPTTSDVYSPHRRHRPMQGTPETRLVWRRFRDMQVCASPPGERFARCAGASVGSSGRNRDGAFFSSRRKEHPCRRVSTKSLGYPSDRGASGKGQDGKDEKRTILQRRRMCTRHTGVIVRCRVRRRRDLCGGVSGICKFARLRPGSGLQDVLERP